MIPTTLAAHADWSVDPRKRWMACARRAGDGWVLGAPAPVGEVAGLLGRLRALADGGAVALGVDMPLGLPRAYAARHAAEADFPAFLRGLAHRPDFFAVCARPDEISAARPFYPRRGVAGMRRAELWGALGLDGPDDLSRACDRATADRPAGACLFWTLGPNQSGKAALAAWRELLLPALGRGEALHLWPFEGEYRALLAQGGVTVAETYPAEALRQLGLVLRGSKRRQADRAALAPALAAAMAGLAVAPEAPMRAAMADGFGAEAAGEDRFDCTLGGLCVIAVL
ncbi:MAG: DUF429 domain-containing protein, partial [Rhodospirillales bacterium]|nr:DUF429 domain-containing protein [Rhodospirillales bacterium]